MDRIDRRLLDLLQQDASLSHPLLGEAVGLSPSQVSRRVQRLIAAGVITRQVALVDPRTVGLGVEAYLMVTLKSHDAEAAARFHERVQAHPAVLDCCALTGDADYMLRVMTENLDTLAALINRGLLAPGDVATVRSSIVLGRIKASTALPIPGRA